MGTNARKEREKEKRKDDIIEAAKKLFLSKGFKKTKLIDIAKNAELAKGTLYLYFDNKEDIYFAVIYQETSKIVNKIEEVLLLKINAIDKLEKISKSIYDYYKNNPDILKAIWYSDYIGTNKNYTPYQKLSFEENIKIFKLIEKIIQEGTKSKLIRNSLEPKKTSIVITKIMMNTIGLLLDADKYEDTPFHEKMTVEEIYYSTFELIKNSLTK